LNYGALQDKDIISFIKEIGRLKQIIKNTYFEKERIIKLALKNLKLRNDEITGQPQIVSTKGMKFSKSADNFIDIPDKDFNKAILTRQKYKETPTFMVDNDMTCFIAAHGTSVNDLLLQLETTISCIEAGLKGDKDDKIKT